MSIIDEDERNFDKDSGRSIYYSVAIKGRIPNAVVLVSRCIDVPCSRCIGHRYNIRHGCPVCGSAINASDRLCKECRSIMMLCGSGNVSAIGIPRIWLELRTKDDVI